MSGPTIHFGDRVGPYRGRVDPDAAVAYALATNDPNPIYLEGEAVGPLYTVALVLPAYLECYGRAVDPGAVTGVRGGVHGEHELIVHRPVRRGDELSWTASTEAAAQTPAGVLITQHVVVDDDQGAPVVEHRWSTILIGGQTEHLGGPPLSDHRFPEEARDRPIGTERFEVTRDQPFRYAGASTDHAGPHVDDVVARSVGFPSKFIQGLCTLGMCTAAVVKHAAGGDPDRVRHLQARLAAPVFPRTTLEVDVFDAGSGPGGGPTVVFEARSGDSVCVRHGRVELTP
jgi:acyl dehydratase